MANTVAAQLFISGAYATKPAFVDEGIEMQVGPDVETGTRPNQISLTWDNSDLSMDPSNVLSALYGLIDLNTLCRVQVGGTTRCVAEAGTWEPDRSINHRVTPARGRSWTDFVAYGVLSRLGLWTDPLRSPEFRQITSYPLANMLGYWPMEGLGTNLPNAISGGYTGKVTGTATWAAVTGAAGSDKTITLGADGAMAGSFIRSNASGFQFVITAKLGTAMPSATFVSLFQFRVSTGITYAWDVNNTTFRISGVTDAGVTAFTSTTTFGTGVDPTQWTRYRVKVTFAAGTITVEPAWYPQDFLFTYGVTTTFAGTTTGNLTTWAIGGSTPMVGTSWAHLFGTTDTVINLAGGYDAVASFNGYKDETAGARFTRLTGEEGIASSILGVSGTTVAMGPQKPGLFLELLEECARSDRGILYDDPAAAALIFRTRRDRQAQTSKMDLTYGNGSHVQPPLKKVIDSVGVINHVTVENRSGAVVTRTLDTGPRSTLPPPNGVGRIKGTIEVNLNTDDTLDDRALFELNLNTQRRPRYKAITVDLLANPSLVAAAVTIRPGDLITLAGVESDPIPLHVISYVESVGHTTRKLTMNCVPGDIWKTGAYGSTGRYDVKSCSTNASLTTTATALAVLLTDPLDAWSTTATGYDLIILGERVRVTTAFSAPVGLVQSGAVVTRSMNGVVRTHAAGEAVHLFDPIHYAY